MGIVNVEEIRKRRVKLGYTQAQAAKAAGWNSTVQWTDVEGGKRRNPTIGTLVAVARVLGCRVDSILRKD